MKLAIANRKINMNNAKIIVDDLETKKKIAAIQELTGENMREIIARLIDGEHQKLMGQLGELQSALDAVNPDVLDVLIDNLKKEIDVAFNK